MNAIILLQRELDKTELREEAVHFLRGLLSDLGTDEMPEDGSYTYDNDSGTAGRFMLAGNGPTAYAVFVEFAVDDVTGYIEYANGQGTTIVHIPDRLVLPLRASLRRDTKARNAR